MDIFLEKFTPYINEKIGNCFLTSDSLVIHLTVGLIQGFRFIYFYGEWKILKLYPSHIWNDDSKYLNTNHRSTEEKIHSYLISSVKLWCNDRVWNPLLVEKPLLDSARECFVSGWMHLN